MKFQKIILASASPRRLELLRQIGIEPEVMVSQVEEKVTSKVPSEVVMELSRQKAEDVAGEQKSGTLIIGSDTVVAVDGKILGKPKSHEEAEVMIRSLVGRTHQVYTGVCVVLKGEPDQILNFYDVTDVEVYPISEEEIGEYAAMEEPMDKAGGHICDTEKHYCWEGKAGGYGIQGVFGARYIKRIIGDYYNVMGLPTSRLIHELAKAGIIL